MTRWNVREDVVELDDENRLITSDVIEFEVKMTREFAEHIVKTYSASKRPVRE